MTEESYRYIISVLKNKKPKPDPEWYEVLGFLFAHRLCGLFYLRANKIQEKLPYKIEKILWAEYCRQCRRNQFMRKEIENLFYALSNAGVNFIFLKGSVLSNLALEIKVYEDGERISNDIDILVSPDNLQMCEKVLADKGKTVTDVDLQAIADNVLEINHKDRIKLNEVTIVSGNKVMPTASVKLTVDGEEVLNAGVGIGPVDAAINAVNSLDIFDDIDFIEYHVDAITGGTDALIDVIIKLQKEDKIISARGTEPDIINASVKAYISGVNRLLSN